MMTMTSYPIPLWLLGGSTNFVWRECPDLGGPCCVPEGAVLLAFFLSWFFVVPNVWNCLTASTHGLVESYMFFWLEICLLFPRLVRYIVHSWR